MVFWMMMLPFYFGKNEDVAKIKKILRHVTANQFSS
jgi:hypothetical protein